MSYVLLKEPMYCEMIADLVHLHPATLQLIRRMKDPDHRLVISDAVPTTHLPDGIYEDNGINVVVTNGRSYTEDGSLNGGGTYISESVRSLVSIGFSEEEAFKAATYNVDRWLGTGYCGGVGTEAFLTGWSKDLTPAMVFFGEQVIDCGP